MNRRQFLKAAGIGGSLMALDCARAAEYAPTRGTAELDAANFHAARRYARNAFGNIAYVERGAGRVALFLHGFPLNGFQWRGALERLSPHRRCIAPDFLGMGFTEVASGQGVGPDDQVAMLVALLEQLGIADVDVVANDSGGAIAQLLLVRHPGRVRTLLLTNCDTEIESPPSAMRPVIELAKQGKYVDEWLAPWNEDRSLARSTQGIGGMCYANPGHPSDEAIDMYFGVLLSSRRRKALANAYAVALERNPLTGIEQALRESRASVGIVWGKADTIFSIQSARYLDRVLGPRYGVRWLEHGKLFWPEEYPDLIAEEACALWEIQAPRA